jgi:NTE family protein
MKTALVLGAGGATGWVFHTGVLRALEDDGGVHPASADLMVGTSAGALIAGALRAGQSTEAIYRAVTRPPSRADQDAMRRGLRMAKKTVRPLAPRLARHALPGGRGLTVALAGLLPPGWFPTGWIERFPGLDEFTAWPDGLWIPAVRTSDATTVVFGRDRTDIPVATAVQASSAVPGMFRPVRIGTHDFVDGGVASSTHADLLVDTDVEVVAISAPMSRPSLRPFARHARRALEREVEALRNRGITVIVIEPSADAVADARGFPRRNPGAATAIVEHAVSATRLALAAA